MEMESPGAFAKRVGLSDKIIRQYIRQGKLPHIKTGKTHVRVHIASALEAIRAMAEISATENIPLKTPVIIPSIPYKQQERKYKGRPPRGAKHG